MLRIFCKYDCHQAWFLLDQESDPRLLVYQPELEPNGTEDSGGATQTTPQAASKAGLDTTISLADLNAEAIQKWRDAVQAGFRRRRPVPGGWAVTSVHRGSDMEIGCRSARKRRQFRIAGGTAHQRKL